MSFSLYRNGGLPKPFLIVGCGRTRWTDAEFRGRMAEAIRAGGGDDSRWRQFSDSIHYRAVDYLDARSVADLAYSLRDLESRHSTRGNRMIYLALPPALYQPAATNLGNAGLTVEHRGNGWARIVLEKPFGADLDSSRELDRSLRAYFSERQIFRIDHYLAKETVQNILIPFRARWRSRGGRPRPWWCRAQPPPRILRDADHGAFDVNVGVDEPRGDRNALEGRASAARGIRRRRRCSRR